MREHQAEGQDSFRLSPDGAAADREVNSASIAWPQVATPSPGGASAQMHALLLNRMGGPGGVSRARHSLLQLQGQYGNHYVQRVLSLSKQGSANRIQRTCAECAEEKNQPEQQAGVVELIPEQPFSERQSGSVAKKEAGAGFEVVRIKEAVQTRDGVTRRMPLGGRPDAWIARKMNWKDTACKAACWAVGGAIGVLIGTACAAGSVFTLGGAVIPCAVALGVIGAAVGGGAASICSDLCDNALAAPTAANAAAPDAAAPDAAVASQNGSPVDQEAQLPV